MAGSRGKPEEIVTKLRQVEVLQAQGMAVAEAVRQIGVTQNTYYRWRKENGGMSRAQLKRLKELAKENQRLIKHLGTCVRQSSVDYARIELGASGASDLTNRAPPRGR